MKKCTHLLGINLTALICLVLSQITYAANCGDASPSVNKGIDPRISIEPRELNTEEIENILGIFKKLEGDWQGEATLIECVGPGGSNAKKRKIEYLVKITVDLKKRDSIELEFELYSSRSRVNKKFLDRLFIDNAYLKHEGKVSGFNATLLIVKDNFFTYLRKTRRRGKGNIPVEYVRTIAIYAKDSVMIEDDWYANGELTSTTLYQLR